MANQRRNKLSAFRRQWYIIDFFGYVFMETK